MKFWNTVLIRMGDGLLFFFALSLFLAFFAPTFFARLDANRFEADQVHAQHMTTLIREADVLIDETWDAVTIRRHIQVLDNTNLRFIPRARRVEYVYDYRKNMVEAVHYSTIFATLDTDPSYLESLSHPERLLGEGRILLSEGGNPLGDRVRNVTHYIDVRLRSRRTRPLSIERLEQVFNTFIERRMLNYAPDQTMASYFDAFDSHFHPTTTLFVNNDLWATQATEGALISRIVFQPGIAHIPQFDLSGFAIGSIIFDEVTLPDTVRTIEARAFPNVFSINVLTFTGDGEVRAEEGAFVGVTNLAGSPAIYVRDDPAFEIVATYQGLPLVTFDPVRFRETLALDLTRMKAYFASEGIDITSYFISVDLGNMRNTRIYLYSQEGYYGFVVPIQE